MPFIAIRRPHQALERWILNIECAHAAAFSSKLRRNMSNLMGTLMLNCENRISRPSQQLKCGFLGVERYESCCRVIWPASKKTGRLCRPRDKKMSTCRRKRRWILSQHLSFGRRAAVVFGFVAFLPENCRFPWNQYASVMPCYVYNRVKGQKVTDSQRHQMC